MKEKKRQAEYTPTYLSFHAILNCFKMFFEIILKRQKTETISSYEFHINLLLLELYIINLLTI